jgi:hypothetical protein
MTLAERHLIEAIKLVEEMPDDPDLVSARWLLGQAVAKLRGWEARHAKTDPSELAPLSSAPPPAPESSL